MARFEGKVALVTGAGGGIGGCVAQSFARAGASVVIVDFVPENGERKAAEIRKEGGRAVFHCADVTKSAEVQAAVKTAVDTYGRLDILVNSHGWSRLAMTTQLAEEDFDRMIAIHLKGTWLTCKYAITEMLKSGGGSIVNLSSMQAYGAVPGRAGYEAAKGGISALTRDLAVEYGPSGIRVNALCPGVVMTEKLVKANINATAEETRLRTECYPLRRLGTPEDVAGAALFLTSSDASWITGVNLFVDGGISIQISEAVMYPPFKRMWDTV